MEFLLEIMTEEMPASHVTSAVDQMKDRMGKELAAAGIQSARLDVFGTSRRLAVAAEITAGQEDAEEWVTGPPKSVGLRPDGSYSPAALGFARSQGIAPEILEVTTTARGEYLGFKRVRKGRSAAEILQDIVPRIVGSLAFSKTMRWAGGSFRFSRPIHGLLGLLDGQLLPIRLPEGTESEPYTLGHRIFDRRRVVPKTIAEYFDLLKERGVIVDPDERRKMILNQIEEQLSSLDAKIHPDPELLEKLVYGVEYPCVVIGGFPEAFLKLPLDVLSTAMREGQNVFSVVRGRKQMPHFVAVADSLKDGKNLIRKGNERVLKARLEDARFFWEQDRKVPLVRRAAELKNVVYQEKLGSYEDKIQRLKKIVAYLWDKVGPSSARDHVLEAAALCKADLLTEMVKEFPSLQGRMGGLYARNEGRSGPVAQAVFEHYQPVGPDDESPASLPGAVLSLADKMDALVGAVGIGVQVTGSSDPYGLRRNAHGVCRIILDKKLRFSFNRLIDKAISVYGDRMTLDRKEVKARCLEFFTGRLRHLFELMGNRYDLVNAALAPGIDGIYDAYLRVKALEGLRSGSQFEPFILMVKRINNILRDQIAAKPNPDLFSEKEERDLHAAFLAVLNNALPMIAKGDYGRAQNIIFKLQPCLTAFFDKVLIMAEDKNIRRNRLGLLKSIRDLLEKVADYALIVVD